MKNYKIICLECGAEYQADQNRQCDWCLSESIGWDWTPEKERELQEED